MTMTYTSLLSLAVVLLLQVLSSDAATPCHICGNPGNSAMSFPNVVLSNVGKTCNQVSLDVAINVPVNTGQCTAKQNQWKQRCCSGNRPSGSNAPTGLTPQNIPSNVQKTGPNAVCNVCRDGDYPYTTSMVINFLYIGEGTCEQYWRYGVEGRIEAHMCNPVQFFSYEPCGCGEHNPFFNKNHPLNQQAQQAPQQNNNNNNGNNNNNNGGGQQAQRTPDSEYADKNNQKMGGQRGGSGGFRRRRGLKGAAAVAGESAPVAVIEV